MIGVMAAGVEFPRGAGLWIPLGVDRAVVYRRGATFLQAIARTKPTVSRQRIVAEVEAVFQRLAADHPRSLHAIPARSGNTMHSGILDRIVASSPLDHA